MTSRSADSTDDGDEQSCTPDVAATEAIARRPQSRSRSASKAGNGPTEFEWKRSSNRNGHAEIPSSVTPTFSRPFIPAASTMALRKSSSGLPQTKGSRRAGAVSFLVLLTAGTGIMLLAAILKSLISYQVEPKGCRMSYMRPSYIHFNDFDTEHTRFATKYSLYLYREQGVDDEAKLRGIPILFIPGNAGSYKQVRPIAAEAATYFYDTLQHDGRSMDSGVRNLDFFTVDFNEDITAFHGQTLLDQAEYLNEAIRYILSLYSDPQRAIRDSQLPDPTSVVILGHSMGGVVARAMLVQSNYQANSINTIITMSAPHSRPPVTFDGQIVQIYDEINAYWRDAYAQKWANNNPLWHVTLISIAGGTLDTVVPSDYASVEPLVPETHGFTVFTTGIPTVWTSMDHQAILWCDQFRKVVAKALYDIVDSNRASQTKPRAQRMQLFRRRFLSGLEAATEKSIALKDETVRLTLDAESSRIVPVGDRLILDHLGNQRDPVVHLLPIPPQETSVPKRFSLLTDSSLVDAEKNGSLEVLVCTVSPGEVGSATMHNSYPTTIPGGSEARLACKNTASDVILLPASTTSIRYPFYLEGESPIRPFSYLQYDLQDLWEYNFIAVVDRATSQTPGFVITEFSERDSIQKAYRSSFSHIAMFGLSFSLPSDRPMAVEVQFPAITSSLLAFHLDLAPLQCQSKRHLYTPIVRQYLDKPYESKYFVGARHAHISLHGIAPYVPPPLEPKSSDSGLGLQIWADPSCDSVLVARLRIDVPGSLGKLYMRYRTVFAAFPLLIVTLVLRKQFRVYDQTGIFIPFSEALDLSLRRSVPLLLISLTLLAVSPEGTSRLIPGLLWSKRHLNAFHRNELLIGTENPSFCLLVPLIGLVCIGVCAVLHYIVLGLTRTLGILYAFFTNGPRTETASHKGIASQVLVPSTPRRRMVSTAVLLFLVSTFIPYQFAYLVACLVQLFTTVRAHRLSHLADSTSSSNYYRYVHSILLLMMWVLPINLPILAVWIRNLAVHWLTPFSSHHNVLSIMPFMLLVENLTTGKMITPENSTFSISSVARRTMEMCCAIITG
ncbi:GPI inositol-deacylase [Metarhizium album ARSEF 1941]|uniref:GPI inositol-deacylase n=1 Tax=Metarhizium album (strain ARSEF 1941) TaxID=1081103 RepID=A0A0B2WUW5_METAS|nr:GPI inositol-deacylase [Metarhizium album ARSEF 1941]KHN97858.1 GPI inositol-deacylase [Metarhizium album ARSEF 1941]